MRFLAIYTSCLFFLLATSCGSSGSQEAEQPSVQEQSNTAPDTETTPAQSPRYAWVDRLNMRSSPTASADIIAKLETNIPLLPTGKNSPQSDAIVLRGVLYVAPWMEVQTPDEQIGWVFGGAVKTAEEFKGNAPISATKFKFPVFGDFDLSEWEKISESVGDDEGDFDGLTTRYQNGQQQLEIETYEGEYGYGNTHKLFIDGSLIKERHFRFENELKEITEEVIDHRGIESIRYTRQQSSPLSYQQLNARPLMVNGTWQEGGEEENRE